MTDNDRVLMVDGCQNQWDRKPKDARWDREILGILRAGDVSAVNSTIAIWENSRETLETIGHWNRRFREHADLTLLAKSADDIRRAYWENKTAIVLHAQNTSPIEDNIDFVEIFADLGLRVMGLTYNTQNLVGSGCYEPEDGGLSSFGKDVVREMNRCGILVCFSHTGERTSMDAIAVSEKPVAITHANPRFAKNVQRNKSDDMLKATAETGGVVGLSPYPHLFSTEGTVQDFCEMAARTADLIGVDHVGIGTDHHMSFTAHEQMWWTNGRWSRTVPSFMSAQGFLTADWQGEDVEWPAWFQTPADTPVITNGLREQGFSSTEVEAIMGGNFLRLYEQVFPNPTA